MDTVNIKCPNCSAPLTFDIQSQKWLCKFCSSEFTEKETFSFDKQSESESEKWFPPEFSDSEAAAYTCPSCGGTVLADKNTVSTFCAFCHAPTILAGKIQGVFRPAKLIPFKLTKEKILPSLQKLCRNKILVPRAFKNSLDNGEITGLYVPFWLYSSKIDVNYSARGKIITSWTSGSYRYKKTDVYNVQRDIMVPLKMLPVDASLRMSDELMDAMEPFEYSDLQPFSMEYLSGHFAESYDVTSEQGAERFKKRAVQGARQEISRTMSAYTVIEAESFNTNFKDLTSTYVMLPLWTFMIKYKQKTYFLAMNGQTGKSAGKLPVSPLRTFIFSLIIFLLTLGITFTAGMII